MLKSVVTPEKSHGKMHFDTLAPFASLLLSVIKSRTLGREGFGSLSPYTTEKKPQQHLYTRAVGTWKNDDEALNLRGRGSLFSDQTRQHCDVVPPHLSLLFHPSIHVSGLPARLAKLRTQQDTGSSPTTMEC